MLIGIGYSFFVIGYNSGSKILKITDVRHPRAARNLRLICDIGNLSRKGPRRPQASSRIQRQQVCREILCPDKDSAAWGRLMVGSSSKRLCLQ